MPKLTVLDPRQIVDGVGVDWWLCEIQDEKRNQIETVVKRGRNDAFATARMRASALEQPSRVGEPR